MIDGERKMKPWLWFCPAMCTVMLTISGCHHARIPDASPQTVADNFCSQRLKEIEHFEKARHEGLVLSATPVEKIQSEGLDRAFPNHEFYRCTWSTKWSGRSAKTGKAREGGGARSGMFLTVGVNSKTHKIHELSDAQHMAKFLKKERVPVQYPESIKELFATCCFAMPLRDELIKMTESKQQVSLIVRCKHGCHRTSYTFALGESGLVETLESKQVLSSGVQNSK